MILDNEFTGDLRVENEVLSLTQKGYKVFVLCFNYGEKANIENFYGAKIVRFHLSKNIKNKLRFFNNTIFDIYSHIWSYQIRKFIKNYNITVLHAHDLYMAKSVILANRKYYLETVLDLHENYPATLATYSWTKTFLGRILVNPQRWVDKEKRYFPKFSKIILLSEDFKKILTNKYPMLESKFYVYPNYPNTENLLSYEINHRILDKGNDFIIFYFGGIAERRGIFTLLESLRLLLAKSSVYKVLLIGPVDKADEVKLKAYLEDPGLRDNIIYYPWKDISLLPSFIAISDVCISPIFKNDQHESGIANKVFQYMLFEKAIIVSNCKPQQQIIEDEKCGFVFESENHADLADKIETLYKDSDLSHEMGIRGKIAVLNKYNLNCSNKELTNLYNSLKHY